MAPNRLEPTNGLHRARNAFNKNCCKTAGSNDNSKTNWSVRDRPLGRQIHKYSSLYPPPAQCISMPWPFIDEGSQEASPSVTIHCHLKLQKWSVEMVGVGGGGIV